MFCFFFIVPMLIQINPDGIFWEMVIKFVIFSVVTVRVRVRYHTGP